MSVKSRLSTSLLLTPLLIGLLGCAGDEHIEYSQEHQDVAQHAPVQAFRHGTYLGDLQCDEDGAPSITQNLWFDFHVYSTTPNKSVTLFWSEDNWSTTNESDAWFEHSLGGSYEQWGVDLSPFGTLSRESSGDTWKRAFSDSESTLCESGCAITVDYYIRYRNNETGEVYWDKNSADDGIKKNYKLIVDNTDAQGGLDSACN